MNQDPSSQMEENTGRFLFLGSGGSMGIPMVGCHCNVCQSPSPYNKRTRPSGVLTVGGRRILIDAGPDFRQQALRENLDRVDGVVFTHAHSDHVAGIDDLRVFYILQRKVIPCLVSAATFADLKRRYFYLFGKPKNSSNLVAKLQFHVLEEETGVVDVLGPKIAYFAFSQGKMPVIGIRVGDFAYVTDIHTFPESTFDVLQGIKTLVVSASQYKSTNVHFSLDEAIAFSQKIAAEKTWITHISHMMEHEEASSRLPEGVAFSYDGLEIEFSTKDW